VELEFGDIALQRLAQPKVRSGSRFGDRSAALFRQRLCELMAADNLEILKTLPALALQSTNGDGRFSIRIDATHRLLFEALGSEPGTSPTQAAINRIRLIAVEEG